MWKTLSQPENELDAKVEYRLDFDDYAAWLLVSEI